MNATPANDLAKLKSRPVGQRLSIAGNVGEKPMILRHARNVALRAAFIAHRFPI
jgi:hypothetical protein